MSCEPCWRKIGGREGRFGRGFLECGDGDGQFDCDWDLGVERDDVGESFGRGDDVEGWVSRKEEDGGQKGFEKDGPAQEECDEEEDSDDDEDETKEDKDEDEREEAEEAGRRQGMGGSGGGVNGSTREDVEA